MSFYLPKKWRPRRWITCSTQQRVTSMELSAVHLSPLQSSRRHQTLEVVSLFFGEKKTRGLQNRMKHAYSCPKSWWKLESFKSKVDDISLTTWMILGFIFRGLWGDPCHWLSCFTVADQTKTGHNRPCRMEQIPGRLYWWKSSLPFRISTPVVGWLTPRWFHLCVPAPTVGICDLFPSNASGRIGRILWQEWSHGVVSMFHFSIIDNNMVTLDFPKPHSNDSWNR